MSKETTTEFDSSKVQATSKEAITRSASDTPVNDFRHTQLWESLHGPNGWSAVGASKESSDPSPAIPPLLTQEATDNFSKTQLWQSLHGPDGWSAVGRNKES